jgi:transposase
MENSVKINVGIDISKDTFWATISQKMDSNEIKHLSCKEFKNTDNGYKMFNKWINDEVFVENELSFTMEATGVYFECLANFLYNNNFVVYVVLPNKAKYFIKSLNTKSKTDKIDSKSLSQMGLERKLRAWQPIQPIFKEIKSLTRERNSLVKFRTQQKNSLHALKYSYNPNQERTERLADTINFLDSQIEKIEKQLSVVLKKDPELKEKIKIIKTIPGIDNLTAAVVISETNGFELIDNAKQLTSYSGLDVKLAESGKWKGKSKISKQGNSHIRGALYLPALSSIRYNPQHKMLYNRIVSKKKLSKIGITAVQRKLLILIYSIWKTEKNFQSINQNIKAA